MQKTRPQNNDIWPNDGYFMSMRVPVGEGLMHLSSQCWCWESNFLAVRASTIISLQSRAYHSDLFIKTVYTCMGTESRVGK